jgi:transcriptional regulator with XRE-family HTH domain
MRVESALALLLAVSPAAVETVMKELSKEQIEFAVITLKKIADARGLNQPQLEGLSGVNQSTISKIFNRATEPSYEVLKKLYQASGLSLSSVLYDSGDFVHDLLGYLATPLTSIVRDPKAETELQRVVEQIKQIAKEFHDPNIDLYWPGDFTHPLKNPNFTPQQVYLTDRSRASTNDFIVVFCAAPSYGVGQENEIATQAGLPAIRFMPPGISRMVSGSFINAIDIPYTGTLADQVLFDVEAVRTAFSSMRKAHFRQRALYKNMNGNAFGGRLRRLIDERSGDYRQFADELGISITYLHALMDEQFAVSNPSARLLKRMAVLLGTTVRFLIGESEETDTIWVESRASWRKWIGANKIDAKIAMDLRDEWSHEYGMNRAELTTLATASARNSFSTMSEVDWDKRYQQYVKKAETNGSQSLF